MDLKKYSQLIKPALIVFAAIIALIVSLTVGYVKIQGIWFIFSFSGIRISTLFAAYASFALVLFMQRKNTVKSIYYAVLAVVFSTGLFEILWYYSAAAYRGWDLRFFAFATLFGWVLLGIREVYNKRPPKVARILYLVFVVTMLVWLASGFSFNDLGSASFSVSDEILNVVSKTALFFAFAIHIGSVK